MLPRLHRRRALVRSIGLRTALALLPAWAVACGPLVENAPFPARPDSVRPADLLGPYDGIVVDADSERPVAGALVAASWAFERGIGLQAPLGAHEVVTETGADGRYQIARLPNLPSGMSTRIRRFSLIVYHRGHVAWRNDRRFPGREARKDFSQRGNKVRLDKWQPTLSHSEHLVFLGGGARVKTVASWELQNAALEMEGERSVMSAAGGAAAAVAAPPLDISALLTQDEIRGVTGYVGKFDDNKLTDLPTTEFYDSHHFKAQGKPESFDVGLRVWRLGTAAAEVQYQRLLAELPGAAGKDEVGDVSLRAKSGAIHGLTFLVRSRGIVVSLTCGASQCSESGQILKLAKLVESRLPELPAEPAKKIPGVPARAGEGEGGEGVGEKTAPEGKGPPPRPEKKP